ncbi:DUF397 domain-containing protein [Nonomuraea sp. NPDC046802]|uniref:DUF397 domain-containing protein n=1 Tax=Nonomuraea sp. NPDC046802 TaxID=3154919 RepID=UPI0033CEC9C4
MMLLGLPPRRSEQASGLRWIMSLRSPSSKCFSSDDQREIGSRMELGLSEELAYASWRKSSFSGDNGNCLEVAPLSDGRVGIRDGERPDMRPFVVSASVWAAFTSGAKAGEFDF